MKNVNDMNRDELRAEAKDLQIPGRGSMRAAQLRESVAYFRSETVRSQAKLQATLTPVTASEVVPAMVRTRFRDRVARGELIVKTPGGVGGLRSITR